MPFYYETIALVPFLKALVRLSVASLFDVPFLAAAFDSWLGTGRRSKSPRAIGSISTDPSAAFMDVFAST